MAMDKGSASSTTAAFFAEYYDNSSPVKLALVLANVVLSSADCALLCKMVAFERRLPESQRTIAARLASSSCLYAIAYSPLAILPQTVQSLTGPWPDSLCQVCMVVEIFISNAFFLIMFSVAIIKGMLVFWLKNMWALQDDLVITFVNVWAPLMALYTTVPAVTLPGHYNFNVAICAGRDVSEPFRHLRYSPRLAFSKVAVQFLAFSSTWALSAALAWLRARERLADSKGDVASESQAIVQANDLWKKASNVTVNISIVLGFVVANVTMRGANKAALEETGVLRGWLVQNVILQALVLAVIAVHYSQHPKLARSAWAQIKGVFSPQQA